MAIETIQGLEYTVSDEAPYLDGDYIRNVLILGRVSKNSWNASRTSAGDTTGVRRKFNKIVDSVEEVTKLNRPSYILHKPFPRMDDDLIGSFENARPADKGARGDFLCRKIAGTEQYHPQVVALRDNVEHKRPFGGFSPTFDFNIDPSDGEVQTILACESIDLVPQPASVKSAIEGEATPEYVTKEEHEKLKTEHSALEERVKACECYMASQKVAATEQVAEPTQRSAVIPEPKKITTLAKSFAEFVRS